MAFDITVPNVTFKTRREIDQAPGFETINQHEQKISLDDFKGKHVILYF